MVCEWRSEAICCWFVDFAVAGMLKTKSWFGLSGCGGGVGVQIDVHYLLEHPTN